MKDRLGDITARELGERFGLEVAGDGTRRLRRVRSVEDAGEGDVSFVRSAKYARWLQKSGASALIVPKDMERPVDGRAWLLSDNPYVSIAAIISHFYAPPMPPAGISERAWIDPTAQIGEGASIEPFVLVAAGARIGKRCHLMSGVRVGRNCRVGDDAVLHAGVVLEEDSVLGDRVVLHPGVVIGSEGFGYAQTEQGNVKMPQIGCVEIGDDVEIGAMTTVDRGALGDTVIGSGTKIDNLVQIAHGVRLGRHNVVCAQAGIAGSVTTGDRVILASRAGVGDHVRIGSNVMVGPMAGVTKDLPDGALVSGFPAMPHNEWLRLMGTLAQLPALREQLKAVLPKAP